MLVNWSSGEDNVLLCVRDEKQASEIPIKYFLWSILSTLYNPKLCFYNYKIHNFIYRMILQS